MEIKHEYSYNTMTALIQFSDGYQPLNEHLKVNKGPVFFISKRIFLTIHALLCRHSYSDTCQRHQ